MIRKSFLFTVMCIATGFFGCGGGSDVANDPIFKPADDVYQAALAGDAQAVQDFMNQSSWDPIVTNYDGFLPLTAAAKGGNPEVIWLMVQDGADVNMTDLRGKTPIQYAQEEGHTEAVAYLKELGAEE